MTQIKAAPIVRQLAQENGIDLSKITGTGKDGFITKKDYEDFTGLAVPVVKADERSPMNHATDMVEVGGMQFRKSRGGFDHSTRQELGVPKKYLNNELEYRWVNDDNGRVERLRELGYANVDSTSLSKDEEISVQRRVGTKKDGSQLNAVLMATPKEWVKERHAKAEQTRTDKEMGMFKAPYDESGKLPEGEFYKKRGVNSGYRD